MMPKLITLSLVWILWLAIPTSCDLTRDECSSPSNCSCSGRSDSYELHCPEVKPQLYVNIKRNDLVQIQCTQSLDNPDVYSYLSGWDIGPVNKFILRFCPLPKTSFLDLMNSIGLTKVKFIQFQSYGNLSDTLTKKHLEGLKEITELIINTNGLTSLPEDIFKDMGNLEFLDLKSNFLKLPKGIFRYVPKLNVLELGKNNLTYLEPGIFRNLTRLRLLNLWGNRLTNLTRSVFTDVTNLQMLDLSTNGMTNIRPDIFADLAHLTSLSLFANEFISLPTGLLSSNTQLKNFHINGNRRTLKTLPNALLANLTKLNDIKMSECNITQLPEDLLWGTSNVVDIYLDTNLLQTLPEAIFKDSTALKTLDLGNNRIEELPQKLFAYTVNLVKLQLHGNRIRQLPERLFSELKNLEVLDLRYNQLIHILPNTFAGLSGLKSLNMSDNQLTFEEDEAPVLDGFGPRSPLKFCNHLEDLQLANNFIKKVFADWRLVMGALRKLNLSNNKITYLKIEQVHFVTMQHIVVDVTFNNISTIDMFNAEVIAESQLRGVNAYERDKQIVVQVKIEGNPLNCDCRLYPFVRYFEDGLSPEVHLLFDIVPGDVRCAEPHLFKNSPIKTVPSKLLTCQYNDGTCPKHCECHYRIANKALVVDCRGAELESMPSSLPIYNDTNHTEVNVGYNKITKFPTTLGKGYERVTKYLMANNDISYINISILSPEIQELDLSGNNLTYLDLDSLNFLRKAQSLRNISLYNNPWQCDCSTIKLKNFLQLRYQKVNNQNNVTCTDGTPIIELSESAICPMSQDIILVSSGIIAMLGLLVGIIIAVYYRYQREIKVWLYAHGYCLWFVSEEELDQDKLFDAFISYSHQDEDFVIDKLVSGLENGPTKYKLCLHFRDWIVGEFIPNQIARSVEDSRRTVVVLSPNFLESVWGRMEFRTAHSQALSERRARVIIILYGDIGPTENLDPELKAYLSMNTYVKWGDPWFWDKLRYSLPHPPGLSKNIPLVKTNAKKPKPTLNLTDKSGLMNGSDPNATPPAVTTPPANCIIIDPLEKTNGHIKTIS